MGIGLGYIRDIEVDDVGDTLDIDSPGSDVGSHQDVVVPLAETVHRPIALILRHVAL